MEANEKMVSRFDYRNVTWIDLESPNLDEVQAVAAERNLNALVAQELLSPTLKPKVDLYRGYFYLVLHFPAIRHSHSRSLNQEVDFVVGRDFIITTHYDTVDPLHEFSKIFEVNSITDREDMGNHAGYVFYYMLRHIYKGMEDELEGVKERLADVESNIFKGRETEMVVELSRISRDILDIKGALRPHEHVLDSLQVAAVRLFGNDFEYPMRAVKNECFRIGHEVLQCAELAGALRDTNNTLVSTRQNEIMKILTIMAFVTFPLSVIASIFGMNTSYLPFVGLPGDFWIIMAIMAALTGAFFVYFKHKKWL